MESSTFLTDDLGVRKQVMEPGAGEMPNAKDCVKGRTEYLEALAEILILITLSVSSTL
jgi:hypothetical protein